MCASLDTESKKGLSDKVVFDQKLEVRHLAIQISAGRTFQAEGMVSAKNLKQVQVGMFSEQQGGQVTKGNRVKVIRGGYVGHPVEHRGIWVLTLSEQGSHWKVLIYALT